MKKVLSLIILSLFLSPCIYSKADASLISNKNYRMAQRKEYRQCEKQIRSLFKVHNQFANKHDLKGLDVLYSDSYVNNDGFTKQVYFKSIEETWNECKDLTYNIKIVSIEINGDYADVQVEEEANGTVYETLETGSIAGEIHSKATGIYHLVRINNKWFISGETALSDESSLLYGDARFMNIEVQAPGQVSAGEEYTASLKVDADDKTFMIASIDSDPVTYPTSTPKSTLRSVPQSHILERVLKANTDNLNEYTVVSLAISKSEDKNTSYKVYLAGLACIMKRVNVIPKNNFAKIED